VFVAVALVLAVIVLVLVHQPWGRLTTSSVGLLTGSIAVPLLLAHDVPDTSECRPPGPCDPAVRLWGAALVRAAVNPVRAVARTRRCPRSSNVVEVYVAYLRKKLRPDVVETVRGMGYRFRG